MRPIDGDRLLQEKRMHTYYHLPNGDIAIPLIDIKNAPTIEPKQGEWIPCSERLPEDLTTVLVWTEGEDIGIAFHMLDDGESDFAKISPAEGKVIAWMPLPEPWEGADDD